MATNKKENIKETDKETAVVKSRSEALKVPFIDMTGKKIPIEALKEIPEEAAAFYQFIPLAKRENVLEIGMVNPDDLRAKEALRFIVRRRELKSKVYIIAPTDFKKVLKQYRSLRGEVQKALKELKKELVKEEKVRPAGEKVEEMAKKIVTEAPITKIVAVILRHAIEGGASDVHIEATEEKIKVRFRVDGILYIGLLLPKEIQPAVVARVKILASLKIDETRIPQDGRFHTVIAGKRIDFRVSTLPTASGEKVVMRVLDPETGLRNFEQIGLRGYNLNTLESATKKMFGMILLTGPTGSGKTTTLYAILNKLNKEGVNIISLEDPVEYFIEGVNQSQIRPEIEYTFASGLRHVLRQDPDIIMVGEIRDEETAALAIHAALTGHIVLSTLHTNNAIGVIPRLVDMGIGPFLLPPSLNVAIAQRLARRLCAHCKKEVIASPKASVMLEEELEKVSPVHKKEFAWKKPFKIYQAAGCKFCGNKGSRDRIAFFEMLAMTPQMENIINTSLTESKIKEESHRQGMITMKQDGVSKVLQGLVSFEEMLRVVEE